jgi:cobalt-zinc-cadmium efflux system outer membrane protein
MTLHPHFRRPVPLVLALASGMSWAVADEANWPRPTGAPMQLPSSELPLAVAPDDGFVDGIPAEALTPTPRTLEEFVALAERSHPRLLAARAAVEAARGKAVQARLYPNPVIAGFSPQMAGPESQWSGTVAQDIVTGGKLRLQQQAALRDIQAAEYELIRARFDVLRGVRQSYYQLLVAQRRMEIYKLLLDIAKRSYEIGRQLAEAGEGTKADVLFWSIERDRAEVRILNATVFIETGRRELAAAIGLPRVDIERLEADLFQELPNFDLKELQEAVVRSNALPRVQEARIAGNQWALERAVVQPIPNVNLMGGYQRQVGIPAQDQGLAQVMMSVPLFDRNQGNIRAARAEIATARADLRLVELGLATQTAQAVAAYRTSQRLVDWYEEYILPKARETVTLTQTLYSRGEVTFLSLLQAQKILTETELAYVDAQAERWTGAVTIADLLQLEEFPPRADAPAVQPLASPTLPEDVRAPAAKLPEAAGGKAPAEVKPAAADARPAAPPAAAPASPKAPPAVPPAENVPTPRQPEPAEIPAGQGNLPQTSASTPASGDVTLVGGVVEPPAAAIPSRAKEPAAGSQQPTKRRGLLGLFPDAYLPGRGAARR